MRFQSLLFTELPSEGISEVDGQEPSMPECFGDLNLDQIVADITRMYRQYDLQPFFYWPLRSQKNIVYRQEIMQELDWPELFQAVKSFASKMRGVHQRHELMERLKYNKNRQGWFLSAVTMYCEAVEELLRFLASSALRSPGMQAFYEHLRTYVQSHQYASLAAEARRISQRLSAIRYCLTIRDLRVTVQPYDGEPDYSEEIDNVFAKFRKHSTKNYRMNLEINTGMSWVEARVLDLVARFYPEPFEELASFCQAYEDYQDQIILRFCRESQFYLSFLDYIRPVRKLGLQFCYPELVASGELYNSDGFDLALASKLASEKKRVVTNDFHLGEDERVIVVSGPNQGGKTTFARSIGQMHFLASIGCPVPGTEARLLHYDGIFTQFEREEDITNLRGKLQDDLFRIEHMLNQVTGRSVLILNEVFTSTTVKDGLYLSEEVMDKVAAKGPLCIWVTFLHELGIRRNGVVSMVSTVEQDDPSQRTYKILRKDPEGLSYAMSIAEKHRLTYEQLKERINPCRRT